MFKACVNDPQYLTNFAELNLDKINGLSNAEDLSEGEVQQKKLIKLFHMAWSGITKYIRTVTQVKNKPIDFPGLGIFMPIIYNSAYMDMEGSRVSSRRLTADKISKLDPSDYDISLCVHQSFVNTTGINIKNDTPESLISVYDPGLGHFIQNTHHINASSVKNQYISP